MSVEDEIILIKKGIKEIQESMKKLTAWAMVMKKLVEKYTGADIDKLMEKENEG